MFLVTLDFRIVHLATNQTLSVKDSVFRVGMEGVLGGVTDTGGSERTVRNVTLGHDQHKTHSRSSSEKETHEGVIR